MIAARDRGVQRAVLAAALAVSVLPILAGVWETGRAAFGILPAIGAEGPTLAPWRAMLALPGFWDGVTLTLWTGIGATVLSLVLAAWILPHLAGTRATRLLAPLLAAPHAALAIGLAFLIAPSGWIVRVLSPWATGWTLPPQIATVNDNFGLALIAGLVVKEVPFLLFVMLAALGQLPVARHLAAGRALGYPPGAVWARVILPQVYPLIRLPVFVVLSFSLSVVDVALILGPSTPPPLSVAITRWFTAPDSALILPGAAAALFQAGLVALVIGVWIAAEREGAAIGRHWIRLGRRGGAARVPAAPIVALALGLLAALSLALLLVWSFTWRWPFPASLPTEWALRPWATAAGLTRALALTLTIGLTSTAAALALAIAWLEVEDRAGGRRAGWAEAMIYLPLLIPQTAFLFGLTIVSLRLGLDGGVAVVIWAHMFFVFPYVMIALSDPWRRIDPALIRTAAALGAGPWRRLWAVKLPVLARPLLAAAAIGFGVSVAQYLPTLFLGAGRVVTLTTEAVTLASGADRRLTAVFAVVQAATPFAAYAAALSVPALLWRNRRGLA